MEGENGEGRPDRKLEDWNIQSIREEQNRERYTSLLSDDALCKILAEGLAYDARQHEKIFGEKPDPGKRFDTVEEQLQDIRRGFGGHNPDGTWKHKNLDRKSQHDIYIIAEGFKAVAYEHLHGGFQAQLHDHFYRNLEDLELKTDTPFHENRREFSDRFELTYEQAKILQRIAKSVNLSYDPGGRELTPENIAKRTFHSKDYLNRPIKDGGIPMRMPKQQLEKLRRKNK